jgi:hypothetical protein
LVWDQIVEKRSLADVFLVHIDSFHFFDTMDMYAGKKEVLDHRLCCIHWSALAVSEFQEVGSTVYLGSRADQCGRGGGPEHSK